MKRTVRTLGLLLIWTLLGCRGEKGEPQRDFGLIELDTIETSVESGITAINGLVDDESGASLAFGAKPTFNSYATQIFNQIIPEAQAANCSRARYEACLTGLTSAKREALYNSCALTSGHVLNGSVSLTYTDLNCNMDLGDSVTRAANFSINGVYGGQLLVSSAANTDYRGVTSGGGGSLTRLSASSWQLDLAGSRKVFNFNGNTLFDMQIRTTSPVTISNTLSRSGRVVDGGAYEVIHNRAEFTATYSPNNLTWSGSCCHPVSGSLSVNYIGSVTGSSVVTFNGCGSATLVKGSLSEQISINYCE